MMQVTSHLVTCIQSSPSIVTPDIVTSLPISTFALAQVTNKLIKKNLSLVTSYSIFIITPFFFGPKGCDYRGGQLYMKSSDVRDCNHRSRSQSLLYIPYFS